MTEIIQILNQSYGTDRNPVKDLGGIILFISNKEEWSEVVEMFGLRIGMEEYEEVCGVINDIEILELLFQISSDYSVVVFTERNNIEY